jgi:hypothetical protein
VTSFLLDEPFAIDSEAFTARSRQGKRHRRGIDARAIAFRAGTDPFGFL